MSFASRAGARIPHTEESDPFFDDVVLLLIGDSLIDRSPLAHTLINTGVQVVSDKALFGSTSIYFDGASWLEFASHVGLNMSNGDWTVEAWAWFQPTSAAWGGIVAGKTRAPDAGAVLRQSAETLVVSGPSYADRGTSGGTVPSGQWVFLVAERNGSNTILAVDGHILVDSPDLISGHVFDLGNGGTTIGYSDVGFGSVPAGSNQFMTAWIDGLRVTKGRARYIADFTPPTTPFPPR